MYVWRWKETPINLAFITCRLSITVVYSNNWEKWKQILLRLDNRLNQNEHKFCSRWQWHITLRLLSEHKVHEVTHNCIQWWKISYTVVGPITSSPLRRSELHTYINFTVYILNPNTARENKLCGSVTWKENFRTAFFWAILFITSVWQTICSLQLFVLNLQFTHTYSEPFGQVFTMHNNKKNTKWMTSKTYL